MPRYIISLIFLLLLTGSSISRANNYSYQNDSVKIGYKVKNNDVFSIFYGNRYDGKSYGVVNPLFEEKKVVQDSIWNEISFSIKPMDEFNVRLDFGKVKNTIEIYYIEIFSGGNVYKLAPIDIINLFHFNVYFSSFSVDSTKLSFNTVQVDQRLDPHIYLRYNQFQELVDNRNGKLDCEICMTARVNTTENIYLQPNFGNSIDSEQTKHRILPQSIDFFKVCFNYSDSILMKRFRIDLGNHYPNKIEIRSISFRDNRMSKNWDSTNILEDFEFYSVNDSVYNQSLQLEYLGSENFSDPFIYLKSELITEWESIKSKFIQIFLLLAASFFFYFLNKTKII